MMLFKESFIFAGLFNELFLEVLGALGMAWTIV